MHVWLDLSKFDKPGSWPLVFAPMTWTPCVWALMQVSNLEVSSDHRASRSMAWKAERAIVEAKVQSMLSRPSFRTAVPLYCGSRQASGRRVRGRFDEALDTDSLVSILWFHPHEKAGHACLEMKRDGA